VRNAPNLRLFQARPLVCAARTSTLIGFLKVLEPQAWQRRWCYELVASVADMNTRARLPEDQIKHATARQSGNAPFLDELENIVERTRRALRGVHGAAETADAGAKTRQHGGTRSVAQPKAHIEQSDVGSIVQERASRSVQRKK